MNIMYKARLDSLNYTVIITYSMLSYFIMNTNTWKIMQNNKLKILLQHES